MCSLYSELAAIDSALQQARATSDIGELTAIAGWLQAMRDVIQTTADTMASAGQSIPVDLQMQIELIDAAIAVVENLIQERRNSAKK